MLACAALLAASGVLLRGQNPAAAKDIVAIQQTIQAGRQDDAAQQIAAALARYPQEAGLYNLRGILHAQRHELAAARKDFEQAVRLAPGLVPAWQNLGRACQMSPPEDASGVECAVEAWRRVLRARPSDGEAHAALATVLEWQGKFAESLRELDALSKTRPPGPSLSALRCADLAGLKRGAEALAEARKLAHTPGFAEPDLASILPVLTAPGNAPLIIVLAEALESTGGRDSLSIGTLTQFAAAYRQAGRLADARAVLERVAMREPDKPEALYALAQVAYEQHDQEGSLGYLAHVRDLTPNEPRVHFLFGLIALQMDLPVEARKSLEKALALDPRNADFHYALGATILSGGGDGKTAAEHFKTFVAARPHESRGHFALGVAYFSVDDYDGCRHEMQMAARDPGKAAGAEFFLGRVDRIEDKLDDAAGHLERSVQLAPSFAESYAELGRVRLNQDRMTDAKAALERALALDPESFQANAALLQFYQKTHDPRLAGQAARLRQLDAARSKRRELMLRTIEVKPYGG